MELRPHQVKAVFELGPILEEHGVALLQGMQRVGKSLIAIQLGFYRFKATGRRVLCSTRKKAMDSILGDALALCGCVDWLVVVNYESLHKVERQNWSMVIADEVHSSGISSFPQKKKSKSWAQLKKQVGEGCQVLLMSGTPCIESPAQLFHQFALATTGPWAIYGESFYEWWYAKDHYKDGRPCGGYGIQDATVKITGGQAVADYSQVDNSRVLSEAEPFIVTVTRESAGFEVEDVDVKTHRLKNQGIAEISRAIMKKGIVEIYDEHGQKHRIVYEQPAQRLQGAHMVAGGTFTTIRKEVVYDENGRPKPKVITEGRILSKMYDPFYRAKWCKEKVSQGTWVIFTQYIKERELLTVYFGDECSEDFQDVLDGNVRIAILSQIRYSMGVDMSMLTGGCILYSLSFSGSHFSQVIDRQLNFSRKTGAEVWVPLLDGGIDGYAFKCVSEKQNFNAKTYKKLALEET